MGHHQLLTSLHNGTGSYLVPLSTELTAGQELFQAVPQVKMDITTLPGDVKAERGTTVLGTCNYDSSWGSLLLHYRSYFTALNPFPRLSSGKH